VFPDGKGKPNMKGMDFYKRLAESLIENGITPAVTLYHWDLPQKLQDIGGWANRDVTDYFGEYAGFVFKELGDKVPIWITHNEPEVVSFVGNWEGRHAPGITDFSNALLVSHNLLLSHGKAVRAYREMGQKGEIGITLNLNPVYPATDNIEDMNATKRFEQYHNRWFLDPVLKGEYPEEILEWYQKRVVLPDTLKEDLEIISTPVDFLGINNYFSSYIKNSESNWPVHFEAAMTGKDKTSIGWEIYPVGMYDLLMFLHKNYKGTKLIITENGAAFDDSVNSSGKVEDKKRLGYLNGYIEQVHRAIQDGVNLKGYYVWSLMDNFEWAHGYTKRFGIVYVDYATGKRIIKESGLWYKELIKNNGF
jgi:beta-glucosidase